MDVVRPLRFQPTIVVCVGPPGRAVRDELALLLPSMDAHRRAGIAFLSFTGKKQPAKKAHDSNSGDARDTLGASDTEDLLLGYRYEPGVDDIFESLLNGDANAGASNRAEQGELRLLTTLVVEALRGRSQEQGQAHTRANNTNGENNARNAPPLGVLDDKIIQQIKDDGYAVPNAQVVVWIVASPQSGWLAQVTRDVRKALDSEGVSGKVLLALSNFYYSGIERRAEQEEFCRSQPWEVLLGIGDRTNESHNGPLADFAYLFEVRDEQGYYWNEQDIAFAIAESVFILTTTAILSTPELDNVLRSSLPHLLTSPIERMGGAGTSRLTFPRAHIEVYCACRMGAAIVSDWAPQVTQSSPQGLQELVNEQGRESHRWVSRLRGAEGTETENTNTVIKALRRSNPTLRLPAAAPDNAQIFRFFSDNELEQLEQGQGDLERVLLNQRPLAGQGLRLWRSTIKRYWKYYENAKLAELSARTSNDVLMGAGGVERVRVYFEHLDKDLGIAKEKLANARERRETTYTAFLNDYAERGRTEHGRLGPWMVTVAPRSIETNDPQIGIRPTQPLNQRIDRTLLTTAPVADTQQPQNPAVPPEPVSREDQIIRQLAARYGWYTRQQSASPSPLPVAVAGTPPMALLEVAVLSALFPLLATPLGVLALTVLTFLGLFAGGRALLPKHREQDIARRDLITFHRKMFQYQTRLAEDGRREYLLIGLHDEVRRGLKRLERWEEFVASLRTTLNDWANGIETLLFEGSIGRRDIFVANQQLLRRDAYGLPLLERDVTRWREERPKPGKEWHAHNGDIVRHLRDEPLEEVSLLKSSEQEIVRPILAFCRTIVRDYLDGPIADIGLALRALPSVDPTGLDQAGLLNILVRRSLILYQPDTNTRHTPLVFICARDQNRMYLKENALTRDAAQARIQDQDWLGTIRITHGGGEPSFWASAINPPPNLPSAPTWRPNPTGAPGTPPDPYGP